MQNVFRFFICLSHTSKLILYHGSDYVKQTQSILIFVIQKSRFPYVEKSASFFASTQFCILLHQQVKSSSLQTKLSQNLDIGV